jgi:hypothetical protein
LKNLSVAEVLRIARGPPEIAMPAKEPPSFFEEQFFTRAQLARALKKGVRTIIRWETLRIGPPRTVLGSTTYFRKTSVEAWLLSREQKPPAARRRARP